MDAWYVAAICGIAGAVCSELLDLHTSLNRDGIFPWEATYGGKKTIGALKYLTEVFARLALGVLAGMAAYGEDPPQSHNLPPHAIVWLAAAGFAAPAVLQKLGGAVRRLRQSVVKIRTDGLVG